MTRRQRHLVDLGCVPSVHDQAPALRIFFHFRDDFVDLIDAHAIFTAPISPLRTVNASEISVLVCPFVPNRHAMFVEIANVGIAAQKPEQLVDDRFEMKFLRREQRESRPGGTQIETRLRAEDRQCACAGAIAARLAVFENKAKEVVILPHARPLALSPGFAKGKVGGMTSVSSHSRWTRRSASLQLPLATVLGRLDLFIEIAFALVECLQTQLPAMQLNGELIDITSDLSSLGFVFF